MVYLILLGVMVGFPLGTLVMMTGRSAYERRRYNRGLAIPPPDSEQLRELAATLERLSQRVALYASTSEAAEKEHAGAA